MVAAVGGNAAAESNPSLDAYLSMNLSQRRKAILQLRKMVSVGQTRFDRVIEGTASLTLGQFAVFHLIHKKK